MMLFYLKTGALLCSIAFVLQISMNVLTAPAKMVTVSIKTEGTCANATTVGLENSVNKVC